MKFVASSLFLVLFNVCLWAQASAPAQSQIPQPPDAQSAPPMHHPMGHDMHQQHMQEMKAQLEKNGIQYYTLPAAETKHRIYVTDPNGNETELVEYHQNYPLK